MEESPPGPRRHDCAGRPRLQCLALSHARHTTFAPYFRPQASVLIPVSIGEAYFALRDRLPRPKAFLWAQCART